MTPLSHKSIPHPSTAAAKAVLVVEDCPVTSHLIIESLEQRGFSTLHCSGVAAVRKLLGDSFSDIGAVLIDIGLPDGDGVALLREIRRRDAAMPCFMLTASDTVETAVIAMKAGARDYFTKPVAFDKLVTEVGSAMAAPEGGGKVCLGLAPVGSLGRKWPSREMRRAMDIATQASSTDSTVFISGANSTGKSTLAETIHRSGKNKGGTFVCFDARFRSEERVLSDWFGVPPGREYDPAEHISTGRLGKSRGTTVYIRDLEILSPVVQFALLKWLERSAAEDRQGGMLCRLIVSSSQSLPALLGKEGFRSDLLHAISVYQISMPSLAERVDDLAIICEDMVTRVCLARGLRRPSLTRIAMEAIQDYPWRGNFSELRSILEHAVTHTRDGIIGSGDLPLLPAVEELQRLGSASIDAVTKASLIVALEDCKGNRRRAAQRLKVSIRTVYNMIDRYQLNANRQGSAPDQN